MRSLKQLKNSDSPLIAVVGPTGSGKSELALVLAEAFGGEIVNCDSVQVYKGLDIGSAKLAVESRRGISHHLLDVFDPSQELTAGGYLRLARPILHEIRDRARIPIVVGGTGFYLKALLDGLSPVPTRDENLRARLREAERRRPGLLYRYLRPRDPEAAKRIHVHDRQKLVRAVELMSLAGRSVTETHGVPRNPLAGFTILKLGLWPERSQLYARLNERCVRMFESGLLAETKTLAEQHACTKVLTSLGYKQALKVIRWEMPLEMALHECQNKTRQYAKRQMTWFRAQPDVKWLFGFGTDPQIQSEASEIMREFLLH